MYLSCDKHSVRDTKTSALRGDISADYLYVSHAANSDICGGYYGGYTTCECGHSPENSRHMLQCSQLTDFCAIDYLYKINVTAKECVEHWINKI